MRSPYRLIPLFALLVGTASMNAALAAHDSETLLPREQARDERSFDPSIQSDGARNPTGEGVGTSTGSPADMGPDNNMQIKGATRDDRPGAGVKPERPTPPSAAQQPARGSGKAPSQTSPQRSP